MANENAIRLQGHEKFALREGWLNKGLIIVKEKPGVFQSDEAPDVFGIGNNFIVSIFLLSSSINTISFANSLTEDTATLP